MALLDGEVQRLRYELGYGTLGVGAVPYIGVTALFEQVVQPYLTAGASTTSSTVVAVAATPTPVTLTLASGTGFAVGCRVVIDVDGRQEVVTAQNVSGTSLTVLLAKAHTGTYPVTVEGGESIIRELLGKIRNVSDRIESAATKAGIKRVDEIELYPEADGGVFASLVGQRSYWRDELAGALGIRNMWNRRRGGASTSLY
jgi:hypothetical protein